MKAGNVLMVCLGNICRSPLAHGIFEALSPYDEFRVDSAGTANYHSGASPDPRSISIARSHNIDIQHQQARQFTVEDFNNFDYIYVMDRQNLQNVLALATTAKQREKVRLLLGNQEVEDPYYGGSEGFSVVYDKIYAACTDILAQWNN